MNVTNFLLPDPEGASPIAGDVCGFRLTHGGRMTTSGTARPHPGSAADDEVARLQAEVDRLRQEVAEGQGRRRGWWRPVVAGLLVAIAALLAPLSVLATWASGQIQDTDRYVATVGPLANDPDVQKAIARRAEQVIFSYLDLDAAMDQLTQAISDQGVPPRVDATLQALAGPLASGIRSFVSDRILAFVQTDAFEQAWIEANRTAHTELVAALTGEDGGAVTVNNGTVQVNLAVLINTIKQQLADAGFGIADRIPEVRQASPSSSRTIWRRCRPCWASLTAWPHGCPSWDWDSWPPR